MRQILHIVRREIYTNTRKKSFLIFSVISPIVFLLPFIFMMFKYSDPNSPKKLLVIDETRAFFGSAEVSDKSISYKRIDLPINDVKQKYLGSSDKEYFGIISLPDNVLDPNDRISAIKLYVRNEADVSSPNVKYIEAFINSKLLEKKLLSGKVSRDSIENYMNFKNVYPIIVQSKRANADKLASILAYIVGMLMYLMLIIFNNSLLRGVLEEKQNRLVEVFSMFVKPFNLMIGKIVGAGILSLLQLVIWVIMSVIYMKIINWIGNEYFGMKETAANSTFSLSYLMDNFKELPLTKIFVFTPIFFILGFLINGAITTVVAATSNAKGNSSLSIVSNFLNIGSIYIAMFSAGYPDNLLAKVSVYIPLFSPIVVPALMPYDLPIHTILISMGILITSFLILVRLAGKIYRISIITYGSKISFKDIIRMVFEKE